MVTVHESAPASTSVISSLLGTGWTSRKDPAAAAAATRSASSCGLAREAILTGGRAGIVDAMRIYNVGGRRDPEKQRLASILWSQDGLQAVLYLDGVSQALFDFAARTGSCRLDFPNFMESQGENWRKSTHAWDESAIQKFEANLYAEPTN